MKRLYTKEELISKLEKLNIERIGNTVITKFNDKIIKTTDVSDRYEVFDIVSYIKSKLELIEKNFDIKEYDLTISGGIQDLKLYSDKIDINGITFHKSFYITNSTDKSRRLSFRVGLFSDKKNIHFVNPYEELDFSKKHYTGINNSVDEVFKNIDKEVFDEQIESLKSLVGHQIKLSNIKRVIIGDKKTNIGFKKFLSFKNAVLNYRMFELDSNQKFEMDRKTDDIKNDFELDAFNVLLTYLKIFSKQDSVNLKKESERILELTKFTVRKSLISQILMSK